MEKMSLIKFQKKKKIPFMWVNLVSYKHAKGKIKITLDFMALFE